MKSKKYVITTLIITSSLLLLIGSFNVIIDPLFQYHKPWFGMESVVTDERYQNAGIAKNFEFDNAVLGNSMCENFIVSDVNDTFGGTTVKLTASGAYCKELTYYLRILNKKVDLKTVFFNFDIGMVEFPFDSLRFEIPEYLYDYNFLNDVNYFFSFDVLKNFSISSVKANLTDSIPDYNRVFCWSDSVKFGKDILLQGYKRVEIVDEEPDIEVYIYNAVKNAELLTPFFESMPDTDFVMFFSPYSMLFWDEQVRGNKLETEKVGLLVAYERMLEYNNVKIYLWTDNEMLGIMSDLDNYKDMKHYSPEINKTILRRIKSGEGLLTEENYIDEVNRLFSFFRSYDYDSIWGSAPIE